MLILFTSSQVFAQFDTEGNGMVDVVNMLASLKTSSGANLQGELSHVIKQLQACSLIPGKRREGEIFVVACIIETMVMDFECKGLQA